MTYYTKADASDEISAETIACRVLVGVSVVIAGYGFWSKGALPGVLMTATMAGLVFLLSRSVGRLVEAGKAKAWRTFVQTAVMAVGFGMVEANLNHLGLELLNEQYGLAPAWALWPACFFLSLVNVFASDTYTRTLTAPAQPVRPALPAPKPRKSRLTETTDEHAARVNGYADNLINMDARRSYEKEISDKIKSWSRDPQAGVA